MDSRAAASSATGSRDPDAGMRWAKTPSGMLREDSVQPTHCTPVCSDSVTARARVVLPTPATPISTTPPPRSLVNVERIESNSAGRSSNCQTLPVWAERGKRSGVALPESDRHPLAARV
jgi:hypothetical protein